MANPRNMIRFLRGIAMHISWSFLDKRKGAIKAISAYDSMDFIVKHTDEEIAAVRVKVEGMIDLASVIGVYPICNTGAVLVHI